MRKEEFPMSCQSCIDGGAIFLTITHSDVCNAPENKTRWSAHNAVCRVQLGVSFYLIKKQNGVVCRQLMGQGF
jgi:hypothetical protein